MIEWILQNLINIIVIALIALAVILIIRGMIKNHRAGKSLCSGNCGECGSCGKGISDK